MNTKKTTNTIAVCESGWILVGIIKREDEETIDVMKTQVVRRWSNGRGIGGLVKEEYKSEYTLDPIGAVSINKSKILFTIPCEW